MESKERFNEKSIWICEGMATDRNYNPLSVGIHFQNINLSIETYVEFNQIHIKVNTNELFKLKDIIDKEVEIILKRIEEKGEEKWNLKKLNFKNSKNEAII